MCMMPSGCLRESNYYTSYSVLRSGTDGRPSRVIVSHVGSSNCRGDLALGPLFFSLAGWPEASPRRVRCSCSLLFLHRDKANKDHLDHQTGTCLRAGKRLLQDFVNGLLVNGLHAHWAIASRRHQHHHRTARVPVPVSASSGSSSHNPVPGGFSGRLCNGKMFATGRVLAVQLTTPRNAPFPQPGPYVHAA